jgi:ABC-type uncharacterized transport system substrate-binding protein
MSAARRTGPGFGKGRAMISRRSILAGAGAAVGLAALLRAQHGAAATVPRIGFLFAAAPPPVAARMDAFREGLAAQNLVDGRNVIFEERYAYGDLTRLPALARELVRLPVSVIVTGGSTATRPALDATTRIPIVMGQDNDPVGAGFVQSLARPGGNVTGLSTLVPELSAKQLALLTELVPGLSRVAAFGDAGEPGNATSVAEVRRAAAMLGVELQYLDRRELGGVRELFAAAKRARAGAVLVLASAYLFAHQSEMIAIALASRMPALYAHPDIVGSGGLATYGVNAVELFRYAAIYVVRILNGAKPADMPIEQPTKFEFVINMKTARLLDLAIPKSVLLRADEVIQ